MMKNIPILITGCARSGTSMVAGIIDICGVFGGNVAGPTKYNQKGQFENEAIRDGLIKPYLLSIGADKYGQNPLPIQSRIKPVLDWKDKVMNIIKQQGYKEGERWYYKGAKMTLMWKVWHKAFPSAQWVIVRRPDNQIIDSCLRTNFMRAFNDGPGWQGWVDYHKARWQEMLSAFLDIKEIWSDRIAKGDFTELRELLDWLNVPFEEEKINDFVEEGLYNAKG